MAKKITVRSVVVFILDILATAFFATMVLIISPFAAQGENTMHKIAAIWSRTLLFISSVRVEVSGQENIPANQPLIFMANHQSNFDILAVLGYIQVQFRWISKKEVFRTPIMGPAMKRAGYISIDRGNRTRAIESLDEAARTIRQGKSVMTFPEGTRSIDGTIKPFKKGSFHLALKARVPIVPVSIVGSRTIMIIAPPIDVSAYSLQNRDDLMKKAHDIISNNFYRKISHERGTDPR
jgi:1-acyl-sn-glycerol-3-phosphate acyltransferase